MTTKVLYHANYNDGSGAALSAFISLGDSAEYIPVQYGSSPPPFASDDIVYIVDFSYKRDVMLKIASTVALTVVLDHHKTAKAELEGIEHPNLKVQFDMNQSGAVLTWKYFHPDRPVPSLLLHIQDRDLWKFGLVGSKLIHRALGMYPDWHDWAQFLFDTSSLLQSGAAIERYLEVQINTIIANPPVEFFATKEVVPVYNLPGFLISDALHMALEKYPECRYAVGTITLPDKTVYSLRSRSGTDVDVSEIATRYSGGGRKHAAGFSV